MSQSVVRTVTAPDGTVIQHEASGRGEPIVFLHGSFVGRDTFAAQEPALSAGYRVILRDLRGHNGSDPTAPADYALETTEINDLIAVLDAEGIDRVHLVGHSTGGAIAFAFARRCPERVRRMVLIEPSLFALPHPEPRAANHAVLSGIRQQAEAGDEAGAARAVFSYILGAGWDRRAPESLIRQVEAAGPMVAPHIRGLLALDVTPDDVRALTPPTLYIYGRRSLAYYFAIYERLGEIHPGANRLLFEDAGHALYVQRADRASQAIRDFLTG